MVFTEDGGSPGNTLGKHHFPRRTENGRRKATYLDARQQQRQATRLEAWQNPHWLQLEHNVSTQAPFALSQSCIRDSEFMIRDSEFMMRDSLREVSRTDKNERLLLGDRRRGAAKQGEWE
jgi:hypothetical protein